MNSEGERILGRLRAALPDLRRAFPLHRLALFGSVVRDQFPGHSDVDIMAEVEPTIGLEFVTLAEELEKLIGREVDLVSRRAIKPSLWQRIEPELIDV